VWSPRGKQIAFICNSYDYNQICVIGKKGGRARVVYRCNCALADPDWGKNNKIVFNHGLNLWIANGKGRAHARKLSIKHLSHNDASGYNHPSWSPNAKRIAFSVGETEESVDTVNASGGNHRRLIGSRAGASGRPGEPQLTTTGRGQPCRHRSGGPGRWPPGATAGTGDPDG
jgi:Tol biopolymer transport system component